MTSTFTLKSQSTEPFDWMIEGVDLSDIEDAADFVEQTVQMSIAATNFDSDMSDAEVYAMWREETDEFEQAVRYIESVIEEIVP